MNKTNLLLLGLILLLIAAGIAIFTQREKTEQVTLKPPPPQVASKQEPIKRPIVHYPVPEAVPAPPQESKEPLEVAKQPSPPPAQPEFPAGAVGAQQVLADLVGKASLAKLLRLDNFIQRFVVTLDNLPEAKLPQAHLPIQGPGGAFLTSGTTAAPQTSRRNHNRYATYVELLEALDSDLMLKFYRHYYPLFQKAYRQLGYQNAYFNDRLVFVLEHLLETPDVQEPIALKRPEVLYTYAENKLERLSYGQKVLLRIGPQQRQRVLKVLQEYRDKLVTLP